LVVLMLAGFPLVLLFPRLLFAALIGTGTHLRKQVVTTICSPSPPSDIVVLSILFLALVMFLA
jgi:hypothetical protein